MGIFKIFIIDDTRYGEILQHHLGKNTDYDLYRFTTVRDSMAALAMKPHLIILDYSLPEGTGTELLIIIKNYNPEIPVIAIGKKEDLALSANLLKASVSEYFAKNEKTKDLVAAAVIRLREILALRNEVEQLRQELEQKYKPNNLIKGNSPSIQKVLTLIEKAGKSNINVSVTGEAGTGKELAAKAIHYCSDRKRKPLVVVNIGNIPDEQIDSELFGHEKGAFNAATVRKQGKFEEANKGTLILDEITALNMSLQGKMLRVLQEKELVRTGGNEKIPLDVRIITITNKNLAEEVAKGNFREELYYRIMGLPIALPPLRERGNDLLILAKYFLDEFCKQNRMPATTLSTAAKEKLIHYHYPGNVQELKAIIGLAAAMCENNEILSDDISYQSTTSASGNIFSRERTLKEYTTEIITTYLQKYNNNVVRVAQKLDIGKSTIYKLISEKTPMSANEHKYG